MSKPGAKQKLNGNSVSNITFCDVYGMSGVALVDDDPRPMSVTLRVNTRDPRKIVDEFIRPVHPRLRKDGFSVVGGFTFYSRKSVALGKQRLLGEREHVERYQLQEARRSGKEVLFLLRGKKRTAVNLKP